MPRTPQNPKAWAWCVRCRTKVRGFQSLKAANKWVWKHTGTEKHRRHLPKLGKRDDRI
jgi:hypothetical protein